MKKQRRVNGTSIFKTEAVIEKVYAARTPCRADIEYLLSLKAGKDVLALFACADRVRQEFIGNGILVRGIIEFSNNCRNTCAYCGLNKFNRSLQRYRLGKDEIMAAARDIFLAGIKTVVLQSGEDGALDPFWLGDVIAEIKSAYNLAVTLSVGERSCREYELWKKAGADRYLLKIETTNQRLYRTLHPQMSLTERIKCSRALKEVGYQNGSGCIVGLPDQRLQTLANDILFFKKEDYDMISVGPFIPHPNTWLKEAPAGELDLALKVIAVARIATMNAHLPATTAVGNIGGWNATIKALRAGANVVMFKFTPLPFRAFYEIYPGRGCLLEMPQDSLITLEKLAHTIGRFVDYSRGDSLKVQKHKPAC